MSKSEGKEKIAKLMHVFIEGIAAGVYETLEDIENDAREYLAMEKVVDKLSNWKENDSVEDLGKLFDGVVNSKQTKKYNAEQKKEWDKIKEMPKIDDVETFLINEWDGKRIGENNVKE